MTAERTVSFLSGDEELFREQMRSSAHGDGASPRTFAYLLGKAAEQHVWERLTDNSGSPFGSFRAFMEAAETDGGLGMTEAQLRHAAALAGIEGLADQLLLAEIPAAAAHGEVGRGRIRDCVTVSNHDKAETVVARLKRDDPELAERVIRGEVSPNAAARSKGWRRPRIVISTPERTAESLRKHMPLEARHALARLLLEE